jgi:hypothetical protein
MSTLTLKNKFQTPPKPKQSRLKGPKYFHEFMGDQLIAIDMQSGRTWTGILTAAHTYELLLNESDHGEMLLFKHGIECLRKVQKASDS